MIHQLAEYAPLPQGSDQFPVEYIEQKGAIKLSETPDQIIIGITKEKNLELETELAFFIHKPLQFVPIQSQDLNEYLSRRFSDTQNNSEVVHDERVTLDKLAHDAPIVNLVNSILMEGIRKGCSDIHLENHAQNLRVRYRIDGMLQTGRTMTTDSFPGISSRLKIMANLNIIERRLPQDGRLSVSLENHNVEFRISIVPLSDGESIVLRLFQKQGGIPKLDGLGFSSFYIQDLRQACQASNGLVLITGPTGSGKTTTLNALVQEMSAEHLKIITIEDPVENVIQGVNQIQTNEEIGLSFETILRRLLRQDPDILMVGEIRDKKTADLSLRSALTGHLVLSTLHTNDALGAIPRLFNMGIEPFLLAAVLRACSAQRLIRTLCPHCKQWVSPTPLQIARLKSLKLDLHKLPKATGCPECHNTGFKGRTVIGEIFLMDEATEELIVQEKKRKDFFQYYNNQGKTFLLADGLQRISAGLTTMEELERVVSLT